MLRDLAILDEPLRSWMTDRQRSEMYTGVVARLERQLSQADNPKQLLVNEKKRYTMLMLRTGIGEYWEGFDMAHAFVQEVLPDWEGRLDSFTRKAFCRTALLVDYIEQRLADYESKRSAAPAPAAEADLQNLIFLPDRVDLVRLKWFVGYYIQPMIRYKYEWAALWIYLSRQGLLRTQEEAAFVKQMNLWYAPSAGPTAGKGPCDTKTFNTYTKLSNLLVDEWDYGHLVLINGAGKSAYLLEEGEKTKEAANAQGVARMKMLYTHIMDVFEEKF